MTARDMIAKGMVLHGFLQIKNSEASSVDLGRFRANKVKFYLFQTIQCFRSFRQFFDTQ